MRQEDFESYVKAGRIAKEVKEFARGYVKRGMKLIDIAEAIDAKILELGGDFGFPVGLGVNEVAAHFTPASDSEEVARDLLKIDIGVAVDGFIGDTAFSLDLSEDSRYKDLIDFNERVLGVASEIVRDGMEVRDIGNAVSDFVEHEGRDEFTIVKGLCGHSLGKNCIHCPPTVSNCRNENSYVFEDDAFAVEPFVSLGSGEIIEGKGGGIYVLQNDMQVRDRDARRVLDFVKERFGGRPFCLRWLTKSEGGSGVRGFGGSGLDISEGKLRFCLRTLVSQGIFYEYPILLEGSRKEVSQAENTFVISGGKVVCTTK